MSKMNWSTEFRIKEAEIKEIRRDISIARKIISDGMALYIKKMLKARSKKQIEDLQTLFADLDDYATKQEIHDAFGWDVITEKQMEYLYGLWDIREKKVTADGKFEDRVILMLKRAMDNIGENFFDELSDFDEIVRGDKETHVRIEAENRDYNYNHYIEGL